MCIGLICIDPLYLWVFLITILISIAAQLFINSQYNKWSQVRNGPDLSGTQVGYAIVNRTYLGEGHSVESAPADSAEVRKLDGLRRKGIITDESSRPKKDNSRARPWPVLTPRSTHPILTLRGWGAK